MTPLYLIMKRHIKKIIQKIKKTIPFKIQETKKIGLLKVIYSHNKIIFTII